MMNVNIKAIIVATLGLNQISFAAQSSDYPLNDTLFEQVHQMSDIAGMAAAIYKDGQLVWQAQAGYADLANKVPVDEQTKFRYASVSKFVTTAMLARLVEQNKIDLNASIYRYLPHYPKKQHDFTPLQLSNHTAGIAHYQFPADNNIDGLDQVYNSVSDGLNIFKARALLHPPGRQFKYSSYGFNLLSAVMESAAKSDFLTLLRQQNQALGSVSIQGESLKANQSHWSKLYNGKGEEQARMNIAYKWAGGGFVGNAIDLAKVGNGLLNRDYVSAKTLAYFTTPTTYSNGEVIDKGSFKAGIGFRLSKDHHGRRFFHHSGYMTGGRSHISVYPEQKLVVTWLANSGWASVMDKTTSMLVDEVLFADKTASKQTKQAITQKFSYSGSYHGKAISGEIQLGSDKGFMTADNELGDTLRKYHGENVKQLAIYPSQQSTHMTLVTPSGMFSIKKSADKWLVSIDEEIELSLTAMYL